MNVGTLLLVGAKALVDAIAARVVSSENFILVIIVELELIGERREGD